MRLTKRIATAVLAYAGADPCHRPTHGVMIEITAGAVTAIVATDGHALVVVYAGDGAPPPDATLRVTPADWQTVVRSLDRDGAECRPAPGGLAVVASTGATLCAPAPVTDTAPPWRDIAPPPREGADGVAGAWGVAPHLLRHLADLAAACHGAGATRLVPRAAVRVSAPADDMSALRADIRGTEHRAMVITMPLRVDLDVADLQDVTAPPAAEVAA